MNIGVDFDNTIVCFDRVFYEAALEKKLIPESVSPLKNEVRDYLRNKGNEECWTSLQGYVYGDAIQKAQPYPGVKDFFRSCRERSIPIHIVSFKTHTPVLGPAYDLHKAAKSWLEANGFHSELGLPQQEAFFETSRENKAQRIKDLQCTHFIDDLPEFLGGSSFPSSMKRILFDPNHHHQKDPFDFKAASWSEVQSFILS